MAKTTKGSGAPKPRRNKSEELIALLRREGGATLTDITGATGWLPHTARAMLTGLRKKGFTLDKTKVDGSTRYGSPASLPHE
jgi:hypothetical protein